jgi:hypothetical protein
MNNIAKKTILAVSAVALAAAVYCVRELVRYMRTRHI